MMVWGSPLYILIYMSLGSLVEVVEAILFLTLASLQTVWCLLQELNWINLWISEMFLLPLAAPQAKRVIDPASCLTVFFMLFHEFSRYIFPPLWPKSCILTSSADRTYFKYQACLDVLLQTSEAGICGEERRKGFLLIILPWRTYMCRCHCTVEQCTTTLVCWISLFSQTEDMICLSSTPTSSSLRRFSWSSRPQLDLHRSF